MGSGCGSGCGSGVISTTDSGASFSGEGGSGTYCSWGSEASALSGVVASWGKVVSVLFSGDGGLSGRMISSPVGREGELWQAIQEEDNKKAREQSASQRNMIGPYFKVFSCLVRQHERWQKKAEEAEAEAAV